MTNSFAVNCPRLDAPIVLAHGLFGFERIGLGPLTLTTYFRGIPEYLKAGGNRVFVPHLPPISGIATRAKALGEQVREAFPDEPVHFICHSMGGLDARALLADPYWRDRTLSLTTIATPHLGSTIADESESRFAGLYKLFHALGIDHQGFTDLTRHEARAFHESHPEPQGVPCFSIAGNPSASSVSAPLRKLHEALSDWEGPNDGVVSVKSALAFGEPIDVWPLDHLRQMNWFDPAIAANKLDPALAKSYGKVVDNLIRKGFTDERKPFACLAELVEL